MIGAPLPGFDSDSLRFRSIALRRFAAIVPASLGDVDFAPDDGFNAALFGRVIERFRSKQIAVIGYGDSRHFRPRRFVDYFFKITGSIEKAVIRVQM